MPRKAQIILPRCRDCGTVQYPPREICRHCLGGHLESAAGPNGGELLSWTCLHVSHEAQFREHVPWQVGLVRLDCGPVVYAHLPAANPVSGSRMEVYAGRDFQGRQVFIAVEPGKAAESLPRLHGLIGITQPS